MSDTTVLSQLLQDTSVPPLYAVEQHFPSYALDDVYQATMDAVEQAIDRLPAPITPGARIAIGVGSRGIANLPALVKALVVRLKALGASPFLVPTMGSHGGATADGQKEVLESLGVTEKFVGAPIHSSMDVVKLGQLPNGLPVYMDRLAYESDGILFINRIKPHTAFRGTYESGLLKMVTIGLGKQKGAESAHAYSFRYMAEHIPAMAQVAFEQANILFGVGVIEDAYDQTSKIVCLMPPEIIEQEPVLLEEAKSLMPRIPTDKIDVLIIDEIGKDISGDGADPNITGRYPTPYAHGGPEVSKMLILRLTERTHGNANGIGTADFTTATCAAQIDPIKGYVNGLTSTVVGPVKLPIPLPNDQLAIQAAIKTGNAVNLEQIRIVRIKNTLHLSRVYVSQAIRDEIAGVDGLHIADTATEFPFDENGNLLDLQSAWKSK